MSATPSSTPSATTATATGGAATNPVTPPATADLFLQHLSGAQVFVARLDRNNVVTAGALGSVGHPDSFVGVRGEDSPLVGVFQNAVSVWHRSDRGYSANVQVQILEDTTSGKTYCRVVRHDPPTSGTIQALVEVPDTSKAAFATGVIGRDVNHQEVIQGVCAAISPDTTLLTANSESLQFLLPQEGKFKGLPGSAPFQKRLVYPPDATNLDSALGAATTHLPPLTIDAGNPYAAVHLEAVKEVLAKCRGYNYEDVAKFEANALLYPNDPTRQLEAAAAKVHITFPPRVPHYPTIVADAVRSIALHEFECKRDRMCEWGAGVVVAMREIHGPDHPATLAAQSALGEVFKKYVQYGVTGTTAVSYARTVLPYLSAIGEADPRHRFVARAVRDCEGVLEADAKRTAIAEFKRSMPAELPAQLELLSTLKAATEGAVPYLTERVALVIRALGRSLEERVTREAGPGKWDRAAVADSRAVYTALAGLGVADFAADLSKGNRRLSEIETAIARREEEVRVTAELGSIDKMDLAATLAYCKALESADKPTPSLVGAANYRAERLLREALSDRVSGFGSLRATPAYELIAEITRDRNNAANPKCVLAVYDQQIGALGRDVLHLAQYHDEREVQKPYRDRVPWRDGDETPVSKAEREVAQMGVTGTMSERPARAYLRLPEKGILAFPDVAAAYDAAVARYQLDPGAEVPGVVANILKGLQKARDAVEEKIPV